MPTRYSEFLVRSNCQVKPVSTTQFSQTYATSGRQRKPTANFLKMMESSKNSDKETSALASSIQVPVMPSVDPPKKLSKRKQTEVTFARFGESVDVRKSSERCSTIVFLYIADCSAFE